MQHLLALFGAFCLPFVLPRKFNAKHI